MQLQHRPQSQPGTGTAIRAMFARNCRPVAEGSVAKVPVFVTLTWANLAFNITPARQQEVQALAEATTPTHTVSVRLGVHFAAQYCTSVFVIG